MTLNIRRPEVNPIQENLLCTEKWRQVAPAQLEPDFYTGLRGRPVFKAIVCGLPILHDVK
ncbi:hypothetical protein CIH92_25345 [Salmonella enterica]|uniref:Uncharacterized protein n=1 Tax=Salmonella enterica TaxID=28901 RepID=A0A747XAV6_SALER|nr:hypothetical protein [Salmonella enterica]EBT1698496.1 hypothetical protein [Salmonella enterica]EBV0539557.1 hypothetical protein [Salmonella enterica subsp. enterica serovar Glostrup]EBW3178667.1 hypothetical protein [Salmonella enterica subsp. enterica serovar Javiana]HAF4686976.1 hypothetical protein [Salmonella enterica]